MGLVHLVRHLGWDQSLAVKSPRPELLTGREDIELFLDEARVWIDLAPHPHICGCHYVRVIDGLPRMFAEFAEGGSLSSAVRAGTLGTLPEILDVGIQMAWGLRAAHEAGVVHQDVKPANVLLAADGRAMVTDFGLARIQARATASAAVQTEPGQSVLVTVGGLTPAYASPEQMAGSRVGRRSDMWSWAVSVLALLLGGVSWSAGPEAVHVLRSEVDRGRIPRRVADILRDCLATDPGDRPRDMGVVADRMVKAYQAATSTRYPRPAAVSGAHMADGWNNKALSLLDLGEHAEAERCWQRALEVDARHPDAVYNVGLARWRAGELSDAALIEELTTVHAAHADQTHVSDLLDLVARERGAAPVERRFEAHSEREVLAIAATPDGRHLLSGGWDGTLRSWDLTTGERISSLNPESENVVFAALTPDGRRAVSSGGQGREPAVWDLRRHRRIGTLKGHTAMVDSGAITSDGRRALTASRDNTLRWWSLPRGRCKRVLTGHSEWVRAVALAPDGRHALSGSRDTTLRWWDLRKGRCLAVLTGHTGWVQAVAVSPDGTRALSGGSDGTTRLWDLGSGRCLQVLQGGHVDYVKSVAFSPDGRYGLSSDLRTVCWWDLSTGRCLHTFSAPDRETGPVAFAGSGEAVVGYADGSIGRFALRAGERAPWSYSAPSRAGDLAARREVFEQYLAKARSLALSDPAGTAAALRAAGSVPGFARDPELDHLWQRIGPKGTRSGLRDVRLLRALGGNEVSGAVYSVTISADGRYAWAGGMDNQARLWDLGDGTCVKSFRGRGPDIPGLAHTLGHANLYAITAVAMTPDGRFGAAASSEGAVQVWDLRTGREFGPLKPPEEGQTADAVAITPDGRRVLSGGLDTTVRLWDVRTGRCLHTLTGHSSTVAALAVTPDGRTGLSCSWDHQICVWDLGTGKCRHTLTGPVEAVNAVAVSNHGRSALVGGWEPTARLYDVRSGECVHVLTGHTSAIADVALTSDARHGLTASWDGTMRWWDLSTGTCLRTIPLTGHVGNIYGLALTPDARHAVTSGDDGTLRHWQFDWNFTFGK
jgi:WD40 repeat protein